MLSCIFYLSETCATIIQKYNNLFDLGLRNSQGKTALIICIEKDNFNIALELLQYRNSLPELNYDNDNIENDTLNIIMSKTNLVFSDSSKYIETLARIISYYLQYNSTSEILHKNIDKICSDNYLKRMLQKYLNKSFIDFDKLCLPIVETNTVIINGNPNIINTRSVTGSEIVATEMEHPALAYPVDDDDDDDDVVDMVIDNTIGNIRSREDDERINNRNIRRRLTGGKNKRKPTTRKRVKTYASKNIKKTKHRKNRKNRKHTKRIKKINIKVYKK